MSTQGGPTGNVGMYVGREMLASVPEDRRDDYLRLVEEISDLKYQLGVEVARQLPRLFQEQDDTAVERYLDQVRSIADVGWKSGVGKAILDGSTSLVELSDAALAEGLNPRPRSGRQEYLENIITRNT